MDNNQPETEKTEPAKRKAGISRWIYGIGALLIACLLVIWLLPSSDKSSDKKQNDIPENREIKTSKKRDGSLEDTINGHKCIDLGLPSGLRWAECNVGASDPIEFGDYFAWGETEPKSDYSAINSLTFKVPFQTLINSGIVDESGTLTKRHDVANTLWGDSWRMPTEDEFEELINTCTWNFTTFNGVNGYMVTGPNGKSIFLPAASFMQNTSIENVGEFGDYWSSSMIKDLSGVACSLGYSSKSYGRRRYARYAGRTIRPVTD